MVRVCEPTASPLAVHGLAQAVAAPPSSLQVMVDAGLETVNATDALVWCVELVGPDVIVMTGVSSRTTQ